MSSITQRLPAIHEGDQMIGFITLDEDQGSGGNVALLIW